MIKIKYKDLLSFTREILTTVGVDEFSTACVSSGLCETSLRGVDSHGIRLLPHYINSAVSGRKNTTPNFMFHQTFPGFGLLDADNAFGHAAGIKAIDLAIDIAKLQGIGAVAVCNSSHPGAMATMALHASRQGYIAFAFTHADSLVLSHGSTRPYFGTNPICFSAPRKGGDPFCLDMATSIIPWNRLMIHKNNNVPLPEGVAADAHGCSTTIASDAKCLMPFGGYKGYGLAAMVEILCGVMTGMQFGKSIPSMYGTSISEPRKLGQFYMVMRTDVAVDSAKFEATLADLANEIYNEPRMNRDQPVMLPGDKEVLEAKKRKVEGVPLDDHTYNELMILGSRYGVSLVGGA
jgi:ureidoglycolate dehydrogenase (NAD+)